MIVYSEEPVTLLDAELVKKWMSHRDAQLFKDCIVAQMNQHYIDSINIQSKAKSKDDDEKFSVQSNIELEQAKQIYSFLNLFEYFSSPKYGFHKIKIKT